MNARLAMQCRSRRPRTKSRAGFTLPEALISSTLFVLLLGGVVGSNLFGMRLFQMASSKLKATDGARKALGGLADEIRQCNSLWIGNVTNGNFVGLLDGELQIGSALLVQPSTNANNVVIYFRNNSDQSLRRMASAGASTTLLAASVTNTGIFSAQDCLGNVLTNSQSDRVIHATLDLVTAQRWLPAGQFSKVETSVTRRLTD
jgi:hypothetical protein